MSESTKLCLRCKRRIPAVANTCRCGWSANTESPENPREWRVDCCFATCGEPAICAVWQATGWANVCSGHYARLSYAPRSTETPVMRQVREAYEGSFAYASKQAGLALAGFIPRSLRQRTPGEDDR